MVGWQVNNFPIDDIERSFEFIKRSHELLKISKQSVIKAEEILAVSLEQLERAQKLLS